MWVLKRLLFKKTNSNKKKITIHFFLLIKLKWNGKILPTDWIYWKNLILNQMLGGILMNAVLNLQKISAKVEEKGIIYTRKCKYEG